MILGGLVMTSTFILMLFLFCFVLEISCKSSPSSIETFWDILNALRVEPHARLGDKLEYIKRTTWTLSILSLMVSTGVRCTTSIHWHTVDKPDTDSGLRNEQRHVSERGISRAFRAGSALPLIELMIVPGMDLHPI
ncbi:hypothetical protein K439DRAFT_402620 [Ramaria rubella]|nr:hypothetical protein K439DRAFT_402620 [Ramaria rubella]